MTYIHVVLKLPPADYRRIRKLLQAAGYGDKVRDGQDGEMLDMCGVALRADGPLRTGPIAKKDIENEP